MNPRTKELAEQAGCFQGMWTTELIGGEIELEHFAELIRQDEREACAKLCDHWASYGAPAAEACAESIRARSKHD